jgi:chlorobactene glucosyltransferase
VAAGLALAAALCLIPAVWRLGRVATVLRGRAELPRASAAPPSSGSTLVSVLVPVRNEERGVEACLASLSAQTYRHLEIIAIDDASTDRTPAILADLARRHPRLRVLRVEGPPPGWTGKTFALDAGVAAARGRWLCFTDADTIHAPGSIAHALGFAEAHGIALLSLTSRQLTGSFWERMIQPVVFGLLDQWFPLARVNDPASPVAAANGIFILAGRDAYEAVGGHRGVASEVLEDLALARRMKARGARIAFVDGADLVAARMYTGLRAIHAGWTRSLYWLCRRRPRAALAAVLELGITQVWPAVACVAAPAVGPAGSRWLALLGLALVLGAELPFRAWRGEDPRWSPTVPLGALVVAAFLAESAVRDWLGRGVRWKDRRYT